MPLTLATRMCSSPYRWIHCMKWPTYTVSHSQTPWKEKHWVHLCRIMAGKAVQLERLPSHHPQHHSGPKGGWHGLSDFPDHLSCPPSHPVKSWHSPPSSLPSVLLSPSNTFPEFPRPSLHLGLCPSAPQSPSHAYSRRIPHHPYTHPSSLILKHPDGRFSGSLHTRR